MESQRHTDRAPASPNGQAVRVLVVEDNADTAESTALILDLHGYHFQLARDGPTALRIAQVDPPDVVLLDIGLPGLNGYEVAQRVRAQPTTKRPFIIAVTGYGQEGDRRRCAEAGIDMHFLKPIEL